MNEYKSDHSDRIERDFLQAVVVLVILYGCTCWTLTKRAQKKPDGNYTRIVYVVLYMLETAPHKTAAARWPISQTIQVGRTRQARHCWSVRDKLISGVLLWTHTHGHTSTDWPVKAYIHRLCRDTGCRQEDLPGAMDDKEWWQERVKGLRAISRTWLYIYIYIYIYIERERERERSNFEYIDKDMHLSTH